MHITRNSDKKLEYHQIATARGSRMLADEKRVERESKVGCNTPASRYLITDIASAFAALLCSHHRLLSPLSVLFFVLNKCLHRVATNR